MKENIDNSKRPCLLTDNKEKNYLQGYPTYPVSEDIYSKYQEEKEIKPDEISITKESNDKDGPFNEKDFSEDISGDDLDVPG